MRPTGATHPVHWKLAVAGHGWEGHSSYRGILVGLQGETPHAQARRSMPRDAVAATRQVRLPGLSQWQAGFAEIAFTQVRSAASAACCVLPLHRVEQYLVMFPASLTQACLQDGRSSRPRPFPSKRSDDPRLQHFDPAICTL
jgi:hypothetical protein